MSPWGELSFFSSRQCVLHAKLATGVTRCATTHQPSVEPLIHGRIDPPIGGPRQSLRVGLASCSPTCSAAARRTMRHRSASFSKMLKKAGCLHHQSLDLCQRTDGSPLIRFTSSKVVSAGTARLTSFVNTKGRKYCTSRPCFVLPDLRCAVGFKLSFVGRAAVYGRRTGD